MRKTAVNAIHALAQRDDRVVFVGSDLGPGVLDGMRREFPDRFFMEGVSEAAIIGLAAGLAMDGFRPYVHTIATFLTRRCYEQIAIDLCLHGLPVRLIAAGGGAVYAPLGPTHMALDDFALLRALPGMTIVAPADADEMARAMDASLHVEGPLYVRIGKGSEPVVTRAEDGFTIGRAIALRPSGDLTIVSTGVMTARALAAADLLADRHPSGVLHVHTIKPLDVTAILDAGRAAKLLVTLEEHAIGGGLGSAVSEALHDGGCSTPLLRLALPDAYIDAYGSQDHVLEHYGLGVNAIAARIAAHPALERNRVRA